ncbi:MAG: hypothetical protein QOG06_2034 [Gaiellaceae bacterium]|nr:hypothetical protein [Gaiellaceae bacterium]
MFRRLLCGSALAGLTLSAGTALAASSGSIGIRLVQAPGTAPAEARGRSYIVDRVSPGTSINRVVQISNTTHSTAVVSVYPAAAGLHRGAFAFAAGHNPNELSRWTHVKRGSIRLAPGAKALTTVAINVPANASAGERYGVVWAEVSSRPAGGVRLVNRVGVRLYVSVGRGGAARPSFAIGRLIAKRSRTGRPLVVAKIRNTGRRTLDISGTLTLSRGPGRLRAGPFAVELGPNLAPGHSEAASVRLDKRLPRGPWRAQLRLRSGFVHRAAAARITFPRRSRAATTPAARAGSGRSHTVALVALAVAILAPLAAALLLYLRMPRGRRGFKPALLGRK